MDRSKESLRSDVHSPGRKRNPSVPEEFPEGAYGIGKAGSADGRSDSRGPHNGKQSRQ